MPSRHPRNVNYIDLSAVHSSNVHPEIDQLILHVSLIRTYLYNTASPPAEAEEPLTFIVRSSYPHLQVLSTQMR